MGQVTIYLDEKVEKLMLDAAKSSGLSKSKWIGNLICEKVNTQWPLSVQEMPGTWNTFPETDKLRANMGKDSQREDF